MKIAVLVSGGVDSSVALNLLKNQGHDLTAFYLKIWLEDELSHLGNCPWEEDLNYVRQVCQKLEVPLEVVSLQKEYWDSVVSYTLAEIKAGRTPNPDILCNQRIKFGAFFDKIDASFDKVATGHYAQVRESNGIYELICSPDAIKDQTYFLSHLNQTQLKRALFPIGHLKKEHVRALAQQFDLPTKNRKDSQGICFLGKLKFHDFVAHYLGERTGDMVEWETGKKIGMHTGYWFYTIGQRQGLGLPGGPWYVVAKDVDKNIVYISKSYHAPDKKRDTFDVMCMNWITQAPTSIHVRVKIRHGQQIYNAAIKWLSSDRIQVQLDERDQGIAAGQFAVFYNESLCLGSGIIV